jgi:hypothetical protein
MGKCPKCGSNDLQASVERNIKDADASGVKYAAVLLIGFLKLLTGFRYSASHSLSFWICGECGHKFRNFQERIGEKDGELKGYILRGAVSVMFVIVFFSGGPDWVLVGVFLAIAAIYAVAAMLAGNKKAKIQKEYSKNLSGLGDKDKDKD